MKLADLINSVTVTQTIGSVELKEVNNITFDSREVDTDSLFIAVKGYTTDGHRFIEKAIEKGACAVVMDDDKSVPDKLFQHAGCVKILVQNSRAALAEISNAFYDNASTKLKLTGVTGTKGKTTTTFYLKNIFETAGLKTGVIGTIANYFVDEKVQSKLTTPQSNETNMMLNKMVQNNTEHCVMEVSSHAAFLHRVDHLDFDFAVFTNITSDHMDFHKSVEHYIESKKIFFDMLKPDAKIVYNIDDEHWRALLKDTAAEKMSYGFDDKADFRISDVEYTLDGTTFCVTYNEETFNFSTKLVGEFNAYNAVSAFAVAILAGIETGLAVEGTNSTPQVPGRFEVVSKGNKKVIVDYSHTSDSLRQALKAIRYIVKNDRPVITVFGCGGDRDKTKRPDMGKIAASMSDKIFVTSDNPRTEDPFVIIDEIVKGIEAENYQVIENREEAIKQAIRNSEDNAVILIAGKGHENYQEINGVRNFFSDKETAERFLA
ncbi:UDP-N-acetylmuramoyl-L-alanyl-D-glutamate--2,6-diaminopimelate ligase [Bacteroidota bacterium]